MKPSQALMHMAGATSYGWDAIRRSGDVAVRDVAADLPSLAANLWAGRRMRAVLDPIARRSRTLAASVKIGLGVGAGLLAAGLWSMLQSNE